MSRTRRPAETPLGRIDSRTLRFVGADERAPAGPAAVPESVVIGNVQLLGSYNWAGDGLLIPGSPPLWRASPAPFVISPAAVSTSVAPPVRDELRAMDAAGIAWAGADVLADRAALVALFHWAHGARAELRLDARAVCARTLALRLIPAKARTRAGSGAGEDWAGAYMRAETVAYPGLGGEYVRVVAYMFGALRMVVRIPVDARLAGTASACLPDAPDAGATAGVRRTAHALVPQDEVLHFTVRAPPRAGSVERRDAVLPKLLFGQIPTHVLVSHDGRGNVVSVEKERVGVHPLLREAETAAQGTLRRVYALLEEIRDVVKAEGRGVVLVMKRSGEMVVLEGMEDEELGTAMDPELNRRHMRYQS